MPTNADVPPEDDDEREMELSALCATFPEIIIDTDDSFTASLELPVVPLEPIQISFTDEAIHAASLNNGTAAPVVTHYLAYLPSLLVRFSLPNGYPTSKPPNFELSTRPAWIPKTTLDRLQDDGERLWEEFGHDQVLFAFLDMLQDAAQNAFGIDPGADLDVSQSDKIALLDFNIKAKKEAFDRETFDCGVCLDPKKGSFCHRMVDCGHVFCTQCLQDFYNNAITTGDLATVRCLDPGCAKEREAKSNPVTSKSRKPRKPKTYISPSELLQIPLEHEMVKRYVTLRHKAQLESDKNTVYCPRKWCQGAARSKKHRKPVGLEIVDVSDSESDGEDKGSEPKPKGFEARSELMRVCEDCSYAFCERCYQGWHGEYFLCIPRNTNGELTAEDKASLEYVRMHSTQCPTCAVPSQKTHGCNHMICFRCGTHFCYLCSAWLNPENPYSHYNTPTGCYMRLWELEGGDGDDVGIGFGGGGHIRPAEDIEEDDDGLVGADRPAVIAPEFDGRPAERPPPLAQPPQQAALAAVYVREDRLVLRIDQLPARAAQPPLQQAALAAPPAMDRRHAAAINRLARGQIEGQLAGQQQPLDENDLALPRRRVQRPNNLPPIPPGQPLRHHENDLIRDARRILQVVDQRRRENPDLRQDPAVRELLRRPPPAHENMSAAELLLQREWLERFAGLALNDEEDDWDSDDDDEDMFDIRN